MLVDAVERAVAALGESDAVAAEVAAVRMLAAAVEERPHNTDLWREFRLALEALREAISGGSGVDEDIKALLARLGDPGMGGTSLRDAADAG